MLVNCTEYLFIFACISYSENCNQENCPEDICERLLPSSQRKILAAQRLVTKTTERKQLT